MTYKLEDFRLMDEFDAGGKTVLLRIDVNSAVIEGEVKLNERIVRHADTIRELQSRNARVVAIAHQGRQGKPDFLPLEQHARLLRRFVDIRYVPDITGEVAVNALKALRDGEAILLENVRMDHEETLKRTPERHSRSHLVRTLAAHADYFINDAFSVAHRAHASIVGFPKVLESYVGRQMEKELTALEEAHAERPVVYILGGSKLDDVLDAMAFVLRAGKADVILTTGVIGNIFMYADGAAVMEEEQKKKYLAGLKRAKRLMLSRKILYPVDVAVEIGGKREELDVRALAPGQHALDIGEETCRIYSEIIMNAGTVIMKGPAGMCENKQFAEGTKVLLKAIIAADAFHLIGGGHTTSVLDMIEERMVCERGYVSLAGGALLMYLAGKPLPGLDVLRMRKSHARLANAVQAADKKPFAAQIGNTM